MPEVNFLKALVITHPFFFTKVRLLFHGRLLLAAQTHQLLLHASLDPYNTTEEMDVSWTDMTMIWSQAEVKLFFL